MKQYDRQTKEWVTEDELKARDLKRQKQCRGNVPHNYVKVLPPYTRLQDGVEATPELVEEYYALLEKHRYECIEQVRELEGLGIQLNYGSSQIKTLVQLRCAKCGKKDLQAYNI